MLHIYQESFASLTILGDGIRCNGGLARALETGWPTTRGQVLSPFPGRTVRSLMDFVRVTNCIKKQSLFLLRNSGYS